VSARLRQAEPRTTSQKRPARLPGQKLLSPEFSTCCMMPIPMGEKFVQYRCLGDMNGEPDRFARQRDDGIGGKVQRENEQQPLAEVRGK
jgi:hypothetical protein